MLRSLMLAAALSAAGLVGSAQSVPLPQQTTLRFNPGETRQDIRGSVVGYQGQSYALNARSGDRAEIRLEGPRNLSLYYNLISPSGRTVFNGAVSGSRYNGTLTETGTYTIQVYLMRNDARRGKRGDFRLSIQLESLSGPGAPSPRPPHGYGPSFDCRKASGTIETTICRNAGLSELDARLAFVYKDALAGAPPNRRFVIQNEQKVWLRTRDECARRAKLVVCLDSAYRARIGVLEPKH